MLIQQPPDAKLPEHLYSNSNIGHYQNPFASSEDRLTSADNHSYPPPRAPSIADSDSPPAYAERQPNASASTSALASDDATVVGSNRWKKAKRRRRLRVAAASVLCVYVTSSAILLGLFFVCGFHVPTISIAEFSIAYLTIDWPSRETKHLNATTNFKRTLPARATARVPSTRSTSCGWVSINVQCMECRKDFGCEDECTT